MMMQQSGVIPSEYERLKYLQSSSTQYIDTLIVPGDNFKVEFSIPFRAAEHSKNHWGCEIYIPGSGYNLCDFWNHGLRGYAGTIYYVSNLQNVTVIYTRTSRKTYVDDILVNTVEYSDTQPPILSIYLFSSHISSGAKQSLNGAAFSYFRATNETDWQIDLIPALRKYDNKPGMYDTVSQTFFVNQGTGEFGYEKMDGTIVQPI